MYVLISAIIFYLKRYFFFFITEYFVHFSQTYEKIKNYPSSKEMLKDSASYLYCDNLLFLHFI